MSRDCKNCGSPEGGNEALCQACMVAARPIIRLNDILGEWLNGDGIVVPDFAPNYNPVPPGVPQQGAMPYVQEPIQVVDLPPPMNYFDIREQEEAEADHWREVWRDQG